MSDKKKIILLSDDMRMNSGIATMSKQFVLGTVDKFDWFQLGAAVKHPEQGKLLDLSQDVQNRTGVEDAYVRVLPWSGYGNADVLRHLINQEQPDAIMHFTDPRYWQWLYQMEHEVRQNVPILFYAIWDDLPDPLYNRNYYESCDWIGCISKQTYGIVSRLTSLDEKPTWKPHDEWQVKYVPHGINTEEYKPVDVEDEFKKEILGDKEYDFMFFWSNRNIRRKQPSDVIHAFKQFCDNLSEEEADKVCLVMHTNPRDDNGTDLPKVIEAIAPDCNIIFSTKKRPVEELNKLYNMADCTINIAGNEGFGLTTAESVMAGTPIIINVTGGLQDQGGFRWKDSGELVKAEEYKEIGSLHEWRKYQDKVTWGEWVIPVWPKVRSLVGSVPTPYIFDDKVDVKEVSEAMLEMYNKTPEERKEMGEKGREAFQNEMGLDVENMCKTMSDGIEDVLENWEPRQRYEVFKIK